jgi:hypothetical protein
LILAEDEQLYDLHRRHDYREAFIVVVLAAEGDPQPMVTASYKIFGVHPDKVWPHIIADRKAKLDTEYESVVRRCWKSQTRCPQEACGISRDDTGAAQSSCLGAVLAQKPATVLRGADHF